MFKKRMRVAVLLFVCLTVFSAAGAVFIGITVKHNKGTGTVTVLSGDIEKATGVKICVGTAERIWTDEKEWFNRENLDADARYFYQTQTVEIAGNQATTGRSYESVKQSDVKNRMYFSGHSVDFPEYHAEWFLCDGFLYDYDGSGPKQYEGFSLSLNEGYHYSGRYLCELNGALYGYLWMEPEYKPHMTVNKGIYRFDEDGTATCILRMGDDAKAFSFLWLVAGEEENTLAVIGAKDNALLAYVYSFDTDEAEERVLWDGGEEFTAWFEEADTCILADMVTDGEQSFLCYTDINLSRVRLSVFEAGSRVFEGEVLQKEYGFGSLQDFSMKVNEANWWEWVADKIEITLAEKEKRK
ncbi:MAG: hypothetical protein PUC30_08345 [Lachnospiraceae bacterium]|nr:hypothetical protein [Lachnospiraceae bacterium]